MEYAYVLIMFIFSALLFLYSFIVGAGRFELIPRGYAVKTDDKKEYARRFGKVLRIVALSPVISGVIFLICALFTDNGDILVLAAVISLIVLFMITLGIGAGLMYKDDPDRSGDQPKE